MKTLLVFGKNGQLARALGQAAQMAGVKVTHIGSAELDLASEPQGAADVIKNMPRVDVVINAAAYTAVDNAETDQAAAHKLNAVAPEVMALACLKMDIPFLHISTDYVFSGKTDAPYTPDKRVDPVNVYGRTKAEGEKAVLAANAKSAIFRTSWVYDAIGANFLTAMLRLGAQKNELKVVADQTGRPTYAPHLAKALLIAAKKMCDEQVPGGIYHISGEGAPVTWHGFATEIFRQAQRFTDVPSKLLPITSKQFGAKAKRPAYAVLDMSGFQDVFDHVMPRWEDGLKEAMLLIEDMQKTARNIS